MVTSNILVRVFRIKYGNGAGTAFTVERNGVQYIVTVKHLFDGVISGEKIIVEILNNGKYQLVSAKIIFYNDPNIDCAVLKTDPYVEVTHKIKTENTMGGIIWGQDVYFLGFPFNYDELIQFFPESKTPAPFVKKACLSGMADKNKILYLDGINNPGFSGGPVCFQDSKTNEYKIAGLINGYRNNISPVYICDENGNDKKTEMYVRENTGIIYACSIEYVLSLIDSYDFDLNKSIE